MMFGINDRCLVNQFIAKKNFLQMGTLNKLEKDELTNNVVKITLSYQLEETKTNIKPYKDEIREYPLINMFLLEVKEYANTKRISNFVMSAIPYPTIIIFKYEEKMQLSASHQRTNQNDVSKNVVEEIVLSKWQDYNEELFDIGNMKLTNCYTLYSDILDFISIQNAREYVTKKKLTGNEARELTTEIERINLQITKLKASLKKETQFNKKVEINMEIRKLEQIRNEELGVRN